MDLVRLLAALAVWAGAVLGCAYVSGRDETRAYARVFGLVALSAPLLVAPDSLVARLVLTLFGILVFGRSLDLARRSDDLSFWGRAWLLVALFDVRRVERCPPRLDGREAAWFIAHLALVGLSWIAVYELAPQLVSPQRWALRWGCGLVLCYGMVEITQSLLLLGYRGLGLSFPRVNDYPILSTTLVEFWGRRWNRAVSGWLNDNLFFPLARRRRGTLGICAAFAGSTALHFWFAWVPLDVASAAIMASFFVVQGFGLLLERRVGVARWPAAARRAWILAWIVVPSPLFVEPALKILAAFNEV